MEFIQAKFGYCNVCLKAASVAELRVRDWLHVLCVCADCAEKLSKKISEQTAKLNERAAVNDLSGKTNNLDPLPQPIQDDPLPETKKLIFNKKDKD
jgi:hypothetical protein